jgi:hypothetical protein
MSEEKNLYSEMDEFLKYEIIQRHSYFQLKYFLIGKEPTNQSKMWQCLRELKSRKDSLVAIDLETEDTKDKIELLDISIQKLSLKDENSGDLNNPKLANLLKKELSIEKRQIERQKKLAENNLVDLLDRKKWIEEECRFFLDSFKNLSKIEPLKHFDDLESQKQYWTERLSRKLNLKMLTQNQLDTELIETIIALPDDMPIKQQTLGTLEIQKKAMIQQFQENMKMVEIKSRETQ